jgi:C-terminal processing protease CtpA/Prc
VFKKIVILQNEYTASASELLILGLYQYTDNLVLIGQNTYGKGVCQLVLDSPENEFALFLVNAYWNVREDNIYYYGIPPHHVANTPEGYQAVLDTILLSIP